MLHITSCKKYFLGCLWLTKNSRVFCNQCMHPHLLSTNLWKGAAHDSWTSSFNEGSSSHWLDTSVTLGKVLNFSEANTAYCLPNIHSPFLPLLSDPNSAQGDNDPKKKSCITQLPLQLESAMGRDPGQLHMIKSFFHF